MQCPYRGVELQRKMLCCNVYYGRGLSEADDELATESMVFMINGISGHWKHPIAYFLLWGGH